LNYSLDEGIDNLRQVMSEYAGRYGDRFVPVKGWTRLESRD